MIRELLVFALLVSFAVSAYALPELPRDGGGQKIQDFAPNGKKSVALTVNSQTINFVSDIRWEVYTPSACSFRLQSSATKVGMKLTLPANAITKRAVNRVTPYVNYTGCASGELQVE